MNIETIWNKLNNKEKEQFKNLLNNQKEQNSQLDEIIIPWKPWWKYKLNDNKKIIIEEIEENNTPNLINKDELNDIKYPIINDSIQKLNNISNKPKIFLGYNIVDIM